MTSDPLDVDVALSQVSETEADVEMKKSWNGCQKYMLRCVARRALFHSVMNTPSQVNLEANRDVGKWYPFYKS